MDVSVKTEYRRCRATFKVDRTSKTLTVYRCALNDDHHDQHRALVWGPYDKRGDRRVADLIWGTS